MAGPLDAGSRLLPPLSAELLAGPGVTPSDPTDHGEFDDQDQERGLNHRADNRRHGLGSEVERIPHGQPSPVAALTRGPVPHREGDGHELFRGERGARAGAKRSLENDGPFTLVVARDTCDIAGVVRRDGRTSAAGKLKGSRTRQIEEPEIHRVLRVAEDEVRLARTGRHLRRNLDRDGVGELGWLLGWRWRRLLLLKRVGTRLLRARRLLRLAGGRRSKFILAKDAALRRLGAGGP